MFAEKNTVLIVDDDPAIRYSLCQIFRGRGHAVRTAEDGFYALQEMAVAIPEVLISDLNMPRMSGFELLSIVRRRFPTVYVIAMSGTISADAISSTIAADGAYEKGSGVVALLKAFYAGIESNRESIWAKRRFTPIWIPQYLVQPNAETQTFISCPDCLRPFYQTVAEHGLAMKTFCTRCQTPIRYAVVAQSAQRNLEVGAA